MIMIELKAGVMRTPHDEGMIFDRDSDHIAVTEGETEFYIKSEVDNVIAEKDKEIVELKGQVNGFKNRSNLWHFNAVEEHKKLVQATMVIAKNDAKIKRLEKCEKWMKDHKEEMKQYWREWYKKNREKVLARRKAKREEKAEEASNLSSSIADKEEVQPSQVLQGSEQ